MASHFEAFEGAPSSSIFFLAESVFVLLLGGRHLPQALRDLQKAKKAP